MTAGWMVLFLAALSLAWYLLRGLSAAAERWALQADPALRIVLAGYSNEHDALLDHGWQRILIRNGRGYSRDPRSGHRERLWLSPSCHAQPTLFEGQE